MIFKSPTNITYRDPFKKSVFLAGSIDMGSAKDWQEDIGLFFYEKGYNVFNPRREDWDSSWKQDYSNPNFYQQVNWELNALEKCDFILLYLVSNTLSPISLLELGKFSNKPMFLICNNSFWRAGNIEIFCDRYNIPLFNDVDSFKIFFEKSQDKIITFI